MGSAAWGHALVTVASDGTVLDAWFPEPHVADAGDDGSGPGLPADTAALIAPSALGDATGPDAARDVTVELRTVVIADLDAPATSTEDVYLRLHLLSHRLVEANTIDLDGIFALLPVIAWTNAGPMLPDVARTRRAALQRAGITVHSLDKFPRLTDYVIPDRVRIADAARVRLGAYLSPGTTIMHEGFVNYNAGTLGASMVEGRISQGVVVGDGSDIGGGASIMGTLSGGGRHRVSIGARSLLGANSGIGISLGDDCVVEAGLYVTAGTKIVVVNGDERETVKGADLSGRDGILYRRNSLTGAIEALPRTGAGIELNAQLHA